MRGGLVTSVMLHAAILGWALFTIQTQRELRVAEPEPIAVDLVSASELTKLRQGVRTAKQLEAEAKESPKAEPAKKEAPKPTPVASAPPPPPPEPPPPREEPRKEPPKEVAAATPPSVPAPPMPAPEEQKRLEDLLKEQERQAEERARIEEERKQAELKKKQEEAKKKKEADIKKKKEEEKKRKEAEAKRKFDADKISALLNKVPDKGAPTPSVPLDEQAKAMKGPVLGAPEGRDSVLSASERAVLAQIIRTCVQSKWNLSGGAAEAMNLEIKLRLQFRPDGTLASTPQVTNQQNTAYFLAASEGAIRAAQQCEPYSLPREKYDAWKDVLMTFSLRDMLR